MSLSLVKKRLISGICSILLFSSIWVMQAPAAYAQEGYIGEIRMVAFNFAPRGWALCDGQLLSIAQNTALFSLIGTIYGGDGRTTFALPDLRGRVPVHAGTGAGLTPRSLGERGGVENVTLNIAQIPSHNHLAFANSGNATTGNPVNATWANVGLNSIYNTSTPNVNMAGATIGNMGGSQSHINMQPYEVVNFIIALQGIYPSRN